MKNVGFFVIFCVSLRHFHQKTAINFSENRTGQHILSLFLFQRSNPQSPSKMLLHLEKAKKALKIGKMWGFCHFLCQIETFSF